MNTTKTIAETLSIATGARASEVGYITPSCIKRNAEGRLICRFEGKEPHPRMRRFPDALVPLKREQQLLDLIEGLDPDKPIVIKVPAHFNGHGCRKQYAEDIYNEFASSTPTSTFHSRILGKILDRDAVKEVSKSLGFDGFHLDVTVKNFLCDM